ncbi:hypothetical protein QR680_006637 [Steinernema hermaphroditum]|uniref:NTR domain-containing protein n=1 Tax=Steinernema hermaphroditum TaxID=289476 RepID=A0AA39HW56_9BILA|nr:hypothetical protein QR680_006637 [Steinernema hermaphroditum]
MHRTALLLCALFAVSFGCNCGIVPPDPQRNFCYSDFVGVLSIVTKRNATEDFPFITYIARYLSVNTIFKSPGDFPSNFYSITVITEKDFAINAGACGVNWLEEGKTYLLNGFVDHGKLYLHSCFQIDAHDEWVNVPQDIKEPLQDGTYKNSCSGSQ